MRVSREKAAENRQRVLEVAGQLFREKGFDGIGVADIMKGAGLTHGGFYGQFESKDDLAAESLAGVMDAAAGRWTKRAAGSPDDPFGAIIGYYLSSRHLDTPGTGCPMAALSGEVSRQPEPVRHVFTEGFERLARILEPTIEGAKDDEDRRRRALAIMAQITGAVIVARALDDPALAEEVLQSVRDALGVGQT